LILDYLGVVLGLIIFLAFLFPETAGSYFAKAHKGFMAEKYKKEN